MVNALRSTPSRTISSLCRDVKLRRLLLMAPLPLQALVRVAPGSGTATCSPYLRVSIRRKQFTLRSTTHHMLWSHAGGR